MERFIGRRLLICIPTLIGVTIVVFITIKIIPGNPVASLAGINSTAAVRAAITHRLGLDQPWPVQYFDWIRSTLQGNLGTSISRQVAVRPLVFSALSNTFILAGAGAVVAFVGGTLLGLWGALRHRHRDGSVADSVAALTVAAPQYSVALVLLVVLTVNITAFPSGGMYNSSGGGGLPALLDHLILPAIAVGLAPLGVIARIFRSSLIDVMNQEFVTSLRARGLSRGAVLRHAIHNTLPSLFTVAGLQIGFLLGGALFVEILFTWPGIGQLIFQSISARDYPVIEACSLVLAVAFVLLNVIIDVGHALVDPRVRQ
ncbi:MAG TPA: ABC transporter permease [Acidimicrobiales bacterium]|jgi:peptide/nickel transport system permease protein|nr:ABC transporter permease [Acidimicrobiales bacterium]